MTKPKNPVTTPEPAPIKDGDALHGTWPGAVPGSGENPLQDQAVPVQPKVPATPAADEPDPNQLASAGPEGAPQPKPRKEDPGINANVVS